MEFLKKYTLLFVVFITGASVLIIEIVAVRILSPYFGNTIFTISSVIGVILAALSLGYYIGGRLADRHPTSNFFYGIILAGGLSVLLLEIIRAALLPLLGYQLSIVTGPLIISIILFFLPAFLLGTLSPFAIKLQTLRLSEEGIGQISGEVFFWSTLGSIFGTLLTGFFLIPHFGISRIILSTGIILSILGLAAFKKAKPAQKLIGIFIILIIISASLYTSYLTRHALKKYVYIKDGVYQQIKIFDGDYRGRPTRFLELDYSLSSAMFLNSDDLVYEYTKYYTLYSLFKPKTKEVLFIGGGAYSNPKILLRELPQAHIDVVEIEPSLFELAQQYFNLPKDPRLTNHTEDGRRFLHDTPKRYDMIFADVFYSIFSVPTHFTTEEFFKIALSKLSENGIYIMNFIGNLYPSSQSLILSEIKTFQSVFPNSYFFAVNNPNSFTSQNIIFVGHNSNKKINFDDPQIKTSDNPIIRSLPQKLIDVSRFDLTQQLKLTDDYAPIEYMITQTIRQQTKR